MGVYATREQVAAALSAPELALPSGEALDALIAEAEGAVDRQLGRYPVNATTGRKHDPALLSVAQTAALMRATVVAVGHLALTDVEQRYGADDLLPAQLTAIRGAGLAVRIDEQLAGFGLIARSGCASPLESLGAEELLWARALLAADVRLA